VSLTAPTHQSEEILALDGQTRTVIFHEMQKLGASMTLLYLPEVIPLSSVGQDVIFINIQAIILSHQVS
jgi:hypothetical protein